MKEVKAKIKSLNSLNKNKPKFEFIPNCDHITKYPKIQKESIVDINDIAIFKEK